MKIITIMAVAVLVSTSNIAHACQSTQRAGEYCEQYNHSGCDGLGNCEQYQEVCVTTYKHVDCTYDRYEKQKEEKEENDKKDDDSTQVE